MSLPSVCTSCHCALPTQSCGRPLWQLGNHWTRTFCVSREKNIQHRNRWKTDNSYSSDTMWEDHFLLYPPVGVVHVPVGVLVHVPALSLAAGSLIYPRGQNFEEVRRGIVEATLQGHRTGLGQKAHQSLRKAPDVCARASDQRPRLTRRPVSAARPISTSAGSTGKIRHSQTVEWKTGEPVNRLICDSVWNVSGGVKIRWDASDHDCNVGSFVDANEQAWLILSSFNTMLAKISFIPFLPGNKMHFQDKHSWDCSLMFKNWDRFIEEEQATLKTVEEEGAEVEDRIQNSLIARFFEVNQNWLNLTPCAKKKKTPSGINIANSILESVRLEIKNNSSGLCL